MTRHLINIVLDVVQLSIKQFPKIYQTFCSKEYNLNMYSELNKIPDALVNKIKFNVKTKQNILMKKNSDLFTEKPTYN